MYWLNFDKRSTHVSKYMCIRGRTAWFSSNESDSYVENFQEKRPSVINYRSYDLYIVSYILSKQMFLFWEKVN